MSGRKSSRVPQPNRALDAQIAEVAVGLRGLGIDPTHSRIAVVLSYLRGELITRFAVRDRRYRMAASEPDDHGSESG